MMWLLLILVLCLGLLLWLPIRVDVDTQQHKYEASWQGILAIWGTPEEAGWKWRYRLFFWQLEWKPGKEPSKKPAKSPKKRPVPGRAKRPFSIRQGWQMLKSLLRAVHIQRFTLHWDTGDYLLNAWLYPVFRASSAGQRQLSINFQGQQDVAILLQTRLGALALAGLRIFFTIIKTKTHAN